MTTYRLQPRITLPFKDGRKEVFQQFYLSEVSATRRSPVDRHTAGETSLKGSLYSFLSSKC